MALVSSLHPHSHSFSERSTYQTLKSAWWESVGRERDRRAHDDPGSDEASVGWRFPGSRETGLVARRRIISYSLHCTQTRWRANRRRVRGCRRRRSKAPQGTLESSRAGHTYVQHISRNLLQLPLAFLMPYNFLRGDACDSVVSQPPPPPFRDAGFLEGLERGSVSRTTVNNGWQCLFHAFTAKGVRGGGGVYRGQRNHDPSGPVPDARSPSHLRQCTAIEIMTLISRYRMPTYGLCTSLRCVSPGCGAWKRRFRLSL